MARIAVLVSNPCTVDARVIKMAHSAARAGYEVHVFATSGPGIPLFEQIDGVTYHRLVWRPGQMIVAVPPLSWLNKISRPAAMFFVKRITPFVKYRLFSKVFAENVARIKPDIVHAHDLICLPAAHDAAALCGAAVVYDAHELEMHRNPPLPFFQKLWVAHVEGKFGRQAAAVNTVGRLVSEVLSKHLRRDDINVLYNSPVIEKCLRNIRSDLDLQVNVPLLIYVGKVTTGRGVGEIMSILPKLDGVFFATVGPSDEATSRILNRKAERTGVADRFRILPPVPFAQVVDYIGSADLGIISVEPVTLSYQYCMPNKLFELSFANVPIISNKLDEIEEFLAENGNGEIVELTEDTALAYRIFRMIREKDRYLMDARQREQLFMQYSWETQQSKLLTIYKNILAKGNLHDQ